MALVYEGESAIAENSSSTSLTFNMPATRPDGELYVAAIGKDGVTAFTQSGWSALGSQENGSAVRGQNWYRVGSSEPATYTTGTESGAEWWLGQVFRFSGAGTPIVTEANGTGSAAIAPAASPTPASDSIILRVYILDRDAPGDNPPSGHTTLEHNDASGDSNDITFHVCKSDTLGDAGAATLGGTYLDEWVAFTIEIPVAAAAGGNNPHYLRSQMRRRRAAA